MKTESELSEKIMETESPYDRIVSKVAPVSGLDGLGNIDEIKTKLSRQKERIDFIHDFVRETFINGTDFGKADERTQKDSLLKPGAEKLSLTFRLRPIIDNDRDIRVDNLGDGQREITVYCHVINMQGVELATGVGSCSTMESKFRYRGGEKIPTGTQVPKEYWNFKKYCRNKKCLN